MNKPIILVSALALTIGIVGTAQHTGGTMRSSAFDVEPTYTVTIPAGITLGETAVITAQDFALQEWESVRVWLSGTGETDNAFRLHSDTHELTYSVTQDGKNIRIGSQILCAKSGDGTQTANLAFSLPNETKPYPGTYQGSVQFTISAVDESIRNVSVPGVGYINAQAGETAVNVNLYNPEGNPCYFRYEIVLKDTGETIWKSDELISPGMQVNQIELSHALEQGDYPAVLKITILSLDEQAELNGSEIGFELRVKGE